MGDKKLCAYIFDGYWEDIGTVGAFFETNLMLTDLQPPFNFYSQNKIIYTHSRYLPGSKIYNSLLDRANVAEGCVLKDCKLTRCMMGIRSVVREGSELENVVMMGADVFESDADKQASFESGIPKFGIGKNCRIKNAIIDKNARIGDNVELCPDGKPDCWESGDLYVRDGVLIVTKNAIIPDGTKVTG